MAFKREGNDEKWLNIVKKRRVDELLSEDIPEDEALLMRNGRYCCTVCNHRPVFDTINILSIHRSGKKHQQNTELFIANKQDLEYLRQQKLHEAIDKGGPIHPKLRAPQFSDHPLHLLGTAPYDPRVKKRKPTDRRPVLLIESKATSSGVTSTTKSSELPGNRSGHSSNVNAQTISEYIKDQRFQNRPQIPLRPYIRKREQESTFATKETQSLVTGDNNADTAFPAKSEISSGGSKTVMDYKQVTYVHKLHNKHTSKVKLKPKPETNLPMYGPTVNESKVQQVAQYLQARGSGWKKDWSGKWIRDEDAEFDSDEEPPDLP